MRPRINIGQPEVVRLWRPCRVGKREWKHDRLLRDHAAPAGGSDLCLAPRRVAKTEKMPTSCVAIDCTSKTPLSTPAGHLTQIARIQKDVRFEQLPVTLSSGKSPPRAPAPDLDARESRSRWRRRWHRFGPDKPRRTGSEIRHGRVFARCPGSVANAVCNAARTRRGQRAVGDEVSHGISAHRTGHTAPPTSLPSFSRRGQLVSTPSHPMAISANRRPIQRPSSAASTPPGSPSRRDERSNSGTAMKHRKTLEHGPDRRRLSPRRGRSTTGQSGRRSSDTR